MCDFCDDGGCDACEEDKDGICAWCENTPCTCDEDDGNGDFGDAVEDDETQTPPALLKKHAYEFINHDEIKVRQQKLISTCAEEIGVTEDEAGCILRAYLWNLEKVKEEWYSDSQRVRKKTGVMIPFDRTKAPATVMCSSAMCEEVPIDEAFALGCGHWFCADCWQGYLQVQAEQGPDCIFTSCPGFNCIGKKKHCKHRNEDNCKCRHMVPESYFYKFTKEEMHPMFSKFVRDSFVDNHRGIRWCSRPGCTVAVAITNDNLHKTIDCKCGFSFCFKCGLAAHAPVPCDLAIKFLKLDQTDALTEALIKATTKPCPKCGVPIEKNEACLHMTCRVCRYNYCWLCKKPWEGHGGTYYQCVQYNEEKKKGVVTEEQKTLRDNVAKLRKYTLFKSQFTAHQKTEQLLAKKATLVDTQNKVEATRIKFLADALKELTRSFRLLKWSYCLTYFCKTGKEKWLFLEQQRLLEETSTKLKDFIVRKELEALCDSEARQFVVNNAAVVKKSVDVSLNDLEAGQLIEVIENEPDNESEGWACIKCNTPVPHTVKNPISCSKCGACLLHGEKQCWGCKPQQ